MSSPSPFEVAKMQGGTSLVGAAFAANADVGARRKSLLRKVVSAVVMAAVVAGVVAIIWVSVATW